MVRAFRCGWNYAALLVLATGCGGDAPPGVDATKAADPVEIAPRFETARDTLDNIDSPAVWHGPAGQHWLIATAKETDVLVVTDAGSGQFIRRVGGTGKARGQMDRPNGIAVLQDLVFLVERDNARVQVFRLPDFQSLGTFGESELRKPYGIALRSAGPDSFQAYVTDNYELVEDSVPPDSALGRRIREYHVTVASTALNAQLTRTFGDTSGPGVLRIVESIALDAENDRLLIAEEQETASMLKAYTLDGKFHNQLVESRFFPNQAEGIVLYACGPREGYWVATDQGMKQNTFHVFERTSLQHLGSFRAAGVLNTDGIALTQQAFGNFPAGAFYAVNNDASVAALSWKSIAEALRLRSDCLQQLQRIQEEGEG